MVPYEGVQIKFKLDFPLGNGAEMVFLFLIMCARGSAGNGIYCVRVTAF